MATYTVTKAKHATLVAATVDTVNVNGSEEVTVLNRAASGTDIYFTIDGSTPTVGGDNCYLCPGGLIVTMNPGLAEGVGKAGMVLVTQVKLISSGTPAYSVQVA